jgi:hypothetical protein
MASQVREHPEARPIRSLMDAQIVAQETRAGDPFYAAGARPCRHCMDSGWVVLGCENDFDEYEEYFTPCRLCTEPVAPAVSSWLQQEEEEACSKARTILARS